MMQPVVVFLGPTLACEDAAKCFDAVYRPPAEQGDIVRAVREAGAKAIVLIDGAFAKVPAVRHKEILWALSRGIPVFGAASMGALRAAELHACGMRGHGLVYRWYRATPLADDDEVAVAMTPAQFGSQALSDALVNIRLTLRRAERRGLIPGPMRRSLEDAARAIHFVDRTYTNLFDRAGVGLPKTQRALIEPLRRWIREHAHDQKREDALGLLRWLASCPGGCRTGRRSHPPFRMTEAWAADLDAAGLSF